MSCSIKLKNASLNNMQNKLCNTINLQVRHKEKVAIVGPNGCGKTTLLNTLAGIHSLDSGSLEIFHTSLTCKDDFKALRPMIGYLFQNSDNQFLAPKVLDDVAFSLISSGLEKSAAYQKALMILEDLNIAHLGEKIVYHLSGGEKKLVALAGVLVMEPKLLLLDEPTTGLDLSMQLRLVKILQKIDKSIVIVSHDTHFLDSIVHKSYTLNPDGLKMLN